MDSSGACDGVYSTGIPRKSSASTARSCSVTERYRHELEDYDVEFDVRPPSGTNHQVLYNPLTFLFLRAFLLWQVVTGMGAEQIIESLANYIWFIRAPNALCF